MSPSDPDYSQSLERLKLMVYLVPIFGVVPALWSLVTKGGSKQEQSVSRLVVTLAVGWLLIYGLLSTGSHLSPAFTMRFLVTNLLVTTGYFLTNLGLMVRLIQGKKVKLPGISRLSDRLP